MDLFAPSPELPTPRYSAVITSLPVKEVGDRTGTPYLPIYGENPQQNCEICGMKHSPFLYGHRNRTKLWACLKDRDAVEALWLEMLA